MEIYAVYWNVGESAGGIEKLDFSDIWTSKNENGWTWDSIGGSHDTYYRHFPNREDAEKFLKELEE